MVILGLGGGGGGGGGKKKVKQGEEKKKKKKEKKRDDSRGEENGTALTADFQTGCRLNTNSYKTQRIAQLAKEKKSKNSRPRLN